MSQNTYSWWEFIKYIIDFFLNRKKQQQEEKEEEFKKTSDNIKNEYDKIDRDKEKQQDKNVEDRLNSAFK
jgi:hypothetical protein